MSTRGTYAKGRAKRQQIVAAAYELVRAKGVRATTLRDVATASDTSSAGVLHHFASMDDLFVEVLRLRDDTNAATARRGRPTDETSIEGLIEVMHENSGEQGLVQLYTVLAADSVDPSHSAHTYFLDRYQRIRSQIARAYRRSEPAGSEDSTGSRRREEPAPTTSNDAERIARLVAAAADGLQLQWLYQPDFDLGTELEYLIDRLGSSGH